MWYFYPRSPCGERPLLILFLAFMPYDFYPRSPCGERPSGFSSFESPIVISIHALLAESDAKFRNWLRYEHNFYPRSPCGERPELSGIKIHALQISIHALLAESDNLPSKPIERKLYFYPRSPCGERLQAADISARRGAFLSTLSLRRATRAEIRASSQQEFLSTLSLRRATPPAPPRRKF